MRLKLQNLRMDNRVYVEPGKAWNSNFEIPGLEKPGKKIELWMKGLEKPGIFFSPNEKKIKKKESS